MSASLLRRPRQAAVLSWAAGAALLGWLAWELWPSTVVRPLPGAQALLQRGAEGTCTAVAEVVGGLGGRLSLRLEGPVVSEGCGGCASGAWPSSACEVRVRPVSGAPGPFGGTLEVRRDGRTPIFVGLSGHASGLSSALHWRVLSGEPGQAPLAFELRNLGDAAGPPGTPVLLGPEAGGIRIAWTDCGAPLPPGGACEVRLEIARPGAAGLLAVPGGGAGIRVGTGDLSDW